MKKILIGTGNQAKVNEYRKLLKGFNLELVSANDLKIDAPEETASTFEQAAIEKAKYYYQKSGLPTIVDDGGFEIEALNNEPGIKSRRWIGREMTDDEIIAEVIKRTADIPEEKLACKHTLVLAVATPFGIYTSHGEIAGVVAKEPSQKRIPGFPYRSVMYLPNYHKYWVEITDQEHDILNHRETAVGKLDDILMELGKD